MDTLDDLLQIKRLLDNRGFHLINDRYSKHVERLKTRMLALSTNDMDTLHLKVAINELEKQSPVTLVEQEAKRIEASIEKAHRKLGAQ